MVNNKNKIVSLSQTCQQNQVSNSIDELCQADSRYRPAAANIGAWLDEWICDRLF